MNILHLKYAVEVAKTQSISKAAENLYMGQPNLSRAIKELEESLGITIFRRTSKGITTTPDGDEFLRRARRIVEQVEEVEELYRNEKIRRRPFSVCVPRASYFSLAMARFSKQTVFDSPADFQYMETNSANTISNVIRGDFSIGIVRYQAGFEKNFTELFEEKKLISETVSEFSYLLLTNKNGPLAKIENISCDDLRDFVEISHGDPYVPSLPLIDVKRTELSEQIDKRIYVYDRASQFTLLENIPNAFMWVSPIPTAFLEQHGLITRRVEKLDRQCKDVLIYRKDYKLSNLDKLFITEVCNAKRECFP